MLRKILISLSSLIGIILVIFLLHVYFFIKLSSGLEEIYSFQNQYRRLLPVVSVFREEQQRFGLFDSEDKYALFIGIRTNSGGSRGVFLAIELFNNNENIESYVKKCEVRYSPEGISFVQPNGYLTFVPKSVYE